MTIQEQFTEHLQGLVDHAEQSLPFMSLHTVRAMIYHGPPPVLTVSIDYVLSAVDVLTGVPVAPADVRRLEVVK